MRRRAQLGFALLIIMLLLNGCGLQSKPTYQVTLQVQGLVVGQSTQTVTWLASNADQPTLNGSAPVTDTELQLPMNLASGVWQVSIELSDDSGKKLYTGAQELAVNGDGQSLVFTVDTAPDKTEPATPWKAWNGTMQPAPTGLLQGPNGYLTPYYVNDSGVAGPVMLINGGMHGDEPAGSLAAWRLVGYILKKGKLIVIPELNRMGLQAKSREGGYPGDPNRDYPQKQGETADDVLSRNVWQLVKEQRVTWLMDLHEGYSYHKVNSASVGQSIILYGGSATQHAERDIVVKSMLNAVNVLITNPNYEFSHLHNPVSGSLARAAGEFLGVAAMTLETCDKQTLSLRIQEQETMVSTAMRELGML